LFVSSHVALSGKNIILLKFNQTGSDQLQGFSSRIWDSYFSIVVVMVDANR
jgi:hypothetical protein